MKAFARKWLLPPGINQLLADAPPSLKRVWGGESSKPEFKPIELDPSGKKAATLEELRTASYGEIVWVETDKIRLWGRALTWQQNQHVRYYKDGIESYRRFFDLHQPRDQFEELLINLDEVGEFSPVRPPKYRAPWSFEWLWTGEEVLGASHGTQRHGPVSERKLFLERRRLDEIRDSVRERGFRIFSEDFILFGELLIDDSDPGMIKFRVVARGGNHRLSLLAHLGWPFVPMIPERNRLLRDVRLSDLPHWPGVIDGTFSEEAARAYFLAHFRDSNEELLPGW